MNSRSNNWVLRNNVFLARIGDDQELQLMQQFLIITNSCIWNMLELPHIWSHESCHDPPALLLGCACIPHDNSDDQAIKWNTQPKLLWLSNRHTTNHAYQEWSHSIMPSGSGSSQAFDQYNYNSIFTLEYNLFGFWILKILFYRCNNLI